jgi:hypothetical protein
MYIDQPVCTRRRHGFAIGTLVAIAASILPGVSEAGEVSVNIQVDEAFVEVIRGIRRAKGIDPPDGEADRKLKNTLARIRAPRSHAGRPAAPRPAPIAIPAHAQLISP